jgi:hypothetical protein
VPLGQRSCREQFDLTRDADCTDASKAVKPPATCPESEKFRHGDFRRESSANARLKTPEELKKNFSAKFFDVEKLFAFDEATFAGPP